jgi:hypothetical protein
MISEDEVSTLYNLATRTGHPRVNHEKAGNVLNGNMSRTTYDTAQEPHTGGGSSQNV